MSKEDATIDRDVLNTAALEYKAQSDKKAEIRLSRESKV